MITFNALASTSKRLIKRKIKTVEKAGRIVLIIMQDRFQMLAAKLREKSYIHFLVLSALYRVVSVNIFS